MGDVAAARRGAFAARAGRRWPPPSVRVLEWCAGAIGSAARVTTTRALPGTAQAVDAVDVVDARGRTHRLVLRRWIRQGWEIDDAAFGPAREARALAALAAARVAAPRVVAVDVDGSGTGAPALLMTRLPGSPPLGSELSDAALTALAAALPPIHAVAAAETGGATVPAYVRYETHETLAVAVARLPATWDRRVWRDAMDVVSRPPPTPPRPRFIHRDFHAGNTVWVDGSLTGVVDWTQASTGDPLVDVGHMRWNLAVRLGITAADTFLHAYLAETADPRADHVYWDLVTALDVLPDLAADGADGLDDVRRLERYVATLLTKP